MKLAKFVSKNCGNTKIEIGEDGDYIVLRQPYTDELSTLGNEDSNQFMIVSKLVPNCIIEHSFLNDDDTPCTSEEVNKALLPMGLLYAKIIEIWMENFPLAKRSNGKSGK